MSDTTATRPPRGRTTGTRLPAAFATAALGGLALFAAHPAPGLWWLVFLVVPAWITAVHLTRGQPAWSSFAVGTVLGVVGYLPMVRWLAVSATWLAPVLLALALGTYLGVASLALRPWTERTSVAWIGPLLWAGYEVARARWPFGGFGWGDLASAHTDASWMLTVARVLGADGLTLLTALLGGMAWGAGRATARAWRSEERDEDLLSPGAGRVVGAFDAVRPMVMGTLAVAVLGTLITAEVPPVVGEADVLVVQGNDGTNAGGGGRSEDLRIARAHLDETRAAVAGGGVPDLTVWAESSFDQDPHVPGNEEFRAVLDEAAAVTEGALVVGVIRDGPDAATFRNSLVAVDADGEPTAVYDKIRIVPFGEYVPFRSLIGDLGPLTRVPRDAIAGEQPQTLPVGDLRLAAVICFETLFPGTVRRAVLADDAGLVVAATNDASFGRGAESLQHVAQSRLRAVETGRSVVHAAISGTSAIIDPTGAVVELAPLYEVTSVRATVPVVSGRTPAMIVGGWVSAALGAGFVLGLLWALGVALRDRRRGATP